MIFDFINKLRFSNPWRFKAPLLISWPYLLIYLTGMNASVSVFYIILAYSTLFGIAALGYFINDIADIKHDKLAGKPNKIGELSVLVRILILFFLLIVSFGPWIWLPKSATSLILILAEILLFILYSFPPFRFKERGILGIFTDSLYAYVLPFILASLTFFYAGNKNYDFFPELLIVSGAWLFIVGVRGILLHQLQDYENDLNAGVKTLVTKIGFHKGEIFARSLLHIETLYFLFFLVFLLSGFYLILPIYLVFIVVRYYQLRTKGQESDYRKFSYRLLDDFYLDILPILILIHLLIKDRWYSPLLLMHFILFRNFIKNEFIKLRTRVRN